MMTQRTEALIHANEIRVARAKEKRTWRRATRAEACAEAARVLENAPEYWANARVAELLLAIPSFGQGRVTTLLVRHQVSPHKRISGLSVRQREEIVASLLAVAAK